MKKIFLITLALLISTTCFAKTDVISNQGTYVTEAQTVIGTTAVSLGSTNPIISVYLKPVANNTNLIYVGDSNVTTANGFEIASGTVLNLNLQTVKGLYAISSGSSQRLSVLTVY